MTGPPKKAPIAGQILPTADGRVAIIGERLEDILDMSTWSEVENTTVPRTAEADARTQVQLAAWEASVAQGVAEQRALHLAESVRRHFSAGHAEHRLACDGTGLLAAADRCEHQAQKGGAAGAGLQTLIDEIRLFAAAELGRDAAARERLLAAAQAVLEPAPARPPAAARGSIAPDRPGLYRTRQNLVASVVHRTRDGRWHGEIRSLRARTQWEADGTCRSNPSRDLDARL